VGDHLAVISADIVNTQDPSGDWVNAPVAPVADDYGWNIEGGDYSIELPFRLVADTPVVYNAAYGAIRMAPTGADGHGDLQGDTVRYAGALPGIEYAYQQTPGGYQETVTLQEGAATTLSWDVTADPGITLSAAEGGTIAIASGDQQLGLVPAPYVHDSSSPLNKSYPAYSLADHGDGHYTLSLTLDPGFVAAAVYPIVVDPGNQDIGGATDSYVNSSQGGTGNGTAQTLKVGGTGGGSQYYTFISFPPGWENPSRIVYSANLMVYLTTGTSSNVTAKRVTGTWNNGVTYNSMPGVDSNNPNPQTWTYNSQTSWGTFDLKRLYQGFVEGTWADYGARLQSSDTKTFSSSRGAHPPHLMVTYDDLPSAPTLDVPGDSTVIETMTPTLKINALPSDPNNDDVMVQYQVTDLQNDWTSAHMQHSGWTSDLKYEAPSDFNLVNGGHFWWRVRSRDVCTQPDTLCSLTKGDGTDAVPNASNARDFTVSYKSWGDDSRYAMWSQDIGNAMTMKVNEGNGNLFMDVPFDQLQTPLGKLHVGLTYNAEMADETAFGSFDSDKGIGPGWRLHAGPASSGKHMPIEVESVDRGVRVRFRGGGTEFFPERGNRSYRSTDGGSGVVHKTANDGYTYTTAGGDYLRLRLQRQPHDLQARVDEDQGVPRNEPVLPLCLRQQRAAAVGDRPDRPAGHVHVGDRGGTAASADRARLGRTRLAAGG
jgi:hypothetical protein